MPAAKEISLNDCWEKIVEIYKVRTTTNLALVLALVTLTGFGFEEGRREIFLIAAVLPFLSLVLDSLSRRFALMPFVYKALDLDTVPGREEPLILLFLAYGTPAARYRRVVEMAAGAERQRAFRKIFVWEKFW